MQGRLAGTDSAFGVGFFPTQISVYDSFNLTEMSLPVVFIVMKIFLREGLFVFASAQSIVVMSPQNDISRHHLDF